MAISRRFFLAAAPLALAGCGAPEPVWAPDTLVNAVRYSHDGPPALTLFTMRKRSSGTGMHTGLMVNAAERLLFDPAGTFAGTNIAERNDVIFGITPRLEQYYISYHARETYYVQIQRAEVSAEVAQLAAHLIKTNGAVGKTRCAVVTGEILSQLPGFGFIRPGIWPGALADQFGTYPGVTSRDYYENDSDDKAVARAAYEADIRAATGL